MKYDKRFIEKRKTYRQTYFEPLEIKEALHSFVKNTGKLSEILLSFVLFATILGYVYFKFGIQGALYSIALIFLLVPAFSALTGLMILRKGMAQMRALHEKEFCQMLEALPIVKQKSPQESVFFYSDKNLKIYYSCEANNGELYNFVLNYSSYDFPAYFSAYLLSKKNGKSGFSRSDYLPVQKNIYYDIIGY